MDAADVYVGKPGIGFPFGTVGRPAALELYEHFLRGFAANHQINRGVSLLAIFAKTNDRGIDGAIPLISFFLGGDYFDFI
mgnify:FL=1